jgi:hypothetical protein
VEWGGRKWEGWGMGNEGEPIRATEECGWGLSRTMLRSSRTNTVHVMAIAMTMVMTMVMAMMVIMTALMMATMMRTRASH